jgi:hypothetical protein
MRVRQIGTLVFDANTNIVVDASNQDAPGIGFRIDSLYDPQPFSVEIAFRRATRQQALDAVSAFARQLHSYAQRRQGGYLAVAGGVLVVAEDATGGTSLQSYLRDSSVTLLGVEATATGVLARARVTGTLVYPFLDYTPTTNTLSSMLPYERRVVALSGLNDAYLYKSGVYCSIWNMSGLYNALLAVEELESATGTSRIQAIKPTSATSGITLQNWNAGWATLTRANFTSAIGGTITYTFTSPPFPHDVYRIFIEIFCPTTPSANARYIISWSDQPQIAETITGDRSWYTPALFTYNTANIADSFTLEIQNVPTGTLAMPIILIPTDGVSVWSVITPPPLTFFRTYDPQPSLPRPFRTNAGGVVYGAPGFISSRYIAVFAGMMTTNIVSASADVTINSHRIEPASFA